MGHIAGWRVCFGLLLGFGVWSCEGDIGGASTMMPPAPPPGSSVPGGEPPTEACVGPARGAPIPLRRLTARQLELTGQDVLGVTVAYTTADETLTEYRANTSTSVQDEAAAHFMQVAEQVAEQVAPMLAGRCQEPCGPWLVDQLAPRLFRRPVDGATRQSLLRLYDLGAQDAGARGGARWLVSAMLQSPRFLYMLEEPGEDGFLDDYAMAARLSYALWGAAPDAMLLEAVDAGALRTEEGIRAAASRMIDDPRFEGAAREFVHQWLRIELLEDRTNRADFFELPEVLREALLEEPVALFVRAVREGASVETLLQEPSVPTDDRLDAFYGDETQRIAGETRYLDPARRAGLLTLPGVQAALSHAEATSPTVRGFVVLDKLFCQRPPPPPVGVTPSLPPASEHLTTRERLIAHFENDTCGGCHRQMDGIGFAFEHYDWLGRYRETEGDAPVDATVDFLFEGHRIQADGPVEMTDAIGGRWDVDQCVAQQWTVFASGIFATDDAVCLVESMGLAARAQGLREMLLTFVSSDWFRRPFPADDTTDETTDERAAMEGAE